MGDPKQEDIDEIDCLNVKDWIQIGGFLIASQLTIIALIWQARPSRGIFTITILLMISFTFFVNSIFSNSKAHHLIKKKEKLELDENQKKNVQRILHRVVNFGYTTFNIGYTFTLIGFTILAYRYMIDFIGTILAVVFLPVIFIGTTWILLVIYTIAKSPGNVISELFEFRKVVSILLELACLIVIILDYLGTITII